MCVVVDHSVKSLLTALASAKKTCNCNSAHLPLQYPRPDPPKPLHFTGRLSIRYCIFTNPFWLVGFVVRLSAENVFIECVPKVGAGFGPPPWRCIRQTEAVPTPADVQAC